MSMSVVSTSELADSISASPDSDSVSISDSNLDDSEDLGDGEIMTADDEPADDSSNAAVDNSADDQKSADDKDSSKDKESSDASTNGADDSSDCNLTITKEGDKKVEVGDTVTWKITVKNSGNTAENVSVKEKLPKNFELVLANASKGTFNEQNSSWEIGDLNKSESATLTIKAKAKKEGNYTNEVSLLTDSNNINKNTTVKADVEVTSKEKNDSSKDDDKKVTKDKKDKKDKKVKKDKPKTNKTKTNTTNQTNQKIDLRKAGNPILVILISVFVVLGLGVLRKQ